MGKLKYQIHKGGRIKYRFLGVCCETSGMWFVDFPIFKWMNPDQLDPKNHPGYSTHFGPCRSVRAFRRRLKQWKQYIPKGTKFRLISRYVGADVFATI